jgi:hypothetical protein
MDTRWAVLFSLVFVFLPRASAQGFENAPSGNGDPATVASSCSTSCEPDDVDSQSDYLYNRLTTWDSSNGESRVDAATPHGSSVVLAYTTHDQTLCGDNGPRPNGSAPTVATASPCTQQPEVHRPWIDPTFYGASGRPPAKGTNFGSISSGSSILRVVRTDGFAIGGGVYVAGAGRSGADYLGTVTGISGSVLTINPPAETSVRDRIVNPDDTAAIQKAIDESCRSGGAVMLPQGDYEVLQHQTGSQAIDPIFTIPTGCQGYGSGFYIYGTGSGFGSTSSQFGNPPQSRITAYPGSNPSMGPIFFVGEHQYTTKFKDLYMVGYNQAIQVYGTANVWFDNISATVHKTGQGIQHGPSFRGDNVPLTIYDTFWVWLVNGTNLSNYYGNTTLPALLLAGVTPLAGGRNIAGLLTVENGIWENGSILYDQRVPQNAGPGALYLKNLLIELPGNNSQPLLTVQDESGSGDMFGVIMDNVSLSDSATPAVNAIVLDASYLYTDFILRNVETGSAGGPAIRLNHGSMHGCVTQGSGQQNRLLVNSTGNVVAGCVNGTNYGFDLVDAPGDRGMSTNYHRTLMTCAAGVFGCQESTTPIRMTDSGDSYSVLGIDGVGGLEMGPPQIPSGYDVELYRYSTQKAALRIAQAQAPLSIVTNLSSGGVLKSGSTLYYLVEATVAANNCDLTNLTGPSIEVSATPTNGEQTVRLTWEASVGLNVAGYCVWRGTKSQQENAYHFVVGTSFVDAGSASYRDGVPSFVNQTYPTKPQFTFDPVEFTAPQITDAGLAPSSLVCTDVHRRLTTAGCPRVGLGPSADGCGAPADCFSSGEVRAAKEVASSGAIRVIHNVRGSDCGSISGREYPCSSVGSVPAGHPEAYLENTREPVEIELSAEQQIPAAVNDAGSVETGWSIGPPCGIPPSLLSRAGTNVLAGYLQFAPGQSACKQVEIPSGWDSATNPYVRVNYTQSGSRPGESIEFLIQTACSTTTDDPGFKAAQSFAVMTTSSTANVPYSATLRLDSTSMSGCGGGRVMNIRITLATTSSATSNLQMLTITWPRKVAVRAN